MSLHDDDAKKKILSRRASFVAAALAGIGTACGREPSATPQPCLSQPLVREDAAPPRPCLTPVRPDAGASEGPLPDAGASESGRPASDAGEAGEAPEKSEKSATEHDAGTAPRPCLKIAPPTASPTGPPKVPPRPCLSVIRRDGVK